MFAHTELILVRFVAVNGANSVQMLQQALYSIVIIYAYATLSLSYTLFVLSIVRLYVIVTVTPQLPTAHLPSSASADSASAEVGNY